MRSRLRAFAASLLGFAVLVVTTRARAREVSFGLSWRTEASTACVDEAALRDAVEQRLARKPFVDPGQAEILLEAEESGAGVRYRARVTERDRHGTILGVRTLEAQSCESLRRASTLIVTLIIDDVTRARAKEVEPPPEDRVIVSEPPPSPRPPLPPPPRLREAPPRVAPPPKLSSRSSLRFSLGLGLGLSVGALPSASATIFGLARLEPVGSRWSFDWSGGYALSQRLDRGPVSGEFAAVEQRVRSCFGFVRWTSSKLDACGGIAWGAVLPTTSGVLQSSDRWRMLVGPTVAVAFEQRARVRANALRLELGLFFSVRQYDFSYLNLARQQSAFYSTDAIIFFVGLSGHGTIS